MSITWRMPAPPRLAEVPRQTLVKRVVDVVAGTVLAIAVLPVIAALAVVVAISSGSWPFFVQERVGLGGRLFRVPKLRTLPSDVPPYIDKYALHAVDVSRLGRLLRRSHLDELPQLLLVPLGRLSLVGPRPEMPNLHHAGDRDFAWERTRVRPGCTGLWQVGDGAGRLIWEAPEFDRFYLRHRSWRLDCWILWRTALLMLGACPPVALDDVPMWVRQGPVP